MCIYLWRPNGKVYPPQVIFDAIEYQDIPVLLGILSVVGALALAAHVVLDVLYICLDPRMRFAEGS